MAYSRKWLRRLALGCSLLLFLGSIPGLSFDKKLRVVSEKAPVHMDPDFRSRVVATLSKGTLLTLRSSRKFRKQWNYVYFTSEKTGHTKSGYILDAHVERLFEVTKIRTLRDEALKGSGAGHSEPHFRNARWGMSREEILKLEGWPGHEEKSGGLTTFIYPQKIMGMDCLIGYVFAENRLVKARYSFLTGHTDKNLYFEDYRIIKDELTHKYGKPMTERSLWRNGQDKKDRSRWGQALGLGHLEYVSRWKNSETEIFLRLFGRDNTVRLVLEYTGLAYKKLAQKAGQRNSGRIW